MVLQLHVFICVHVGNIMTFSRVLDGGGGGPNDPLNWLPNCCKLVLDKNVLIILYLMSYIHINY